MRSFNEVNTVLDTSKTKGNLRSFSAFLSLWLHNPGTLDTPTDVAHPWDAKYGEIKTFKYAAYNHISPIFYDFFEARAGHLTLASGWQSTMTGRTQFLSQNSESPMYY